MPLALGDGLHVLVRLAVFATVAAVGTEQLPLGNRDRLLLVGFRPETFRNDVVDLPGAGLQSQIALLAMDNAITLGTFDDLLFLVAGEVAAGCHHGTSDRFTSSLGWHRLEP